MYSLENCLLGTELAAPGCSGGTGDITVLLADRLRARWSATSAYFYGIWPGLT